MGSPKKQYNYTDLLTLKESKETVKGVNVIAVVKFFREPIKTRGTSYSMTVGLTDPSLDGDKLICSIFNDCIERLPKLETPGDVLICHRLLVERFSGEMRGCGLPGRGFSWGMVSGTAGAPLEVRSDRDNFNATKADLRKAEALMKWYRSPECPVMKESPVKKPRSESGSAESGSPAKKARVESCSVEQVSLHRPFCDLSGQLLAKFRLQLFPQCVMLRLWDGTVPQGKVRNVENLAAEDVTDVEETSCPQLRWLSRFRFVDVCVFDDHVASCSALKPGNLVLLTNLRVAVASGSGSPQHTMQLRLQGGGQHRFGRGVRRLCPEDPELRVLEPRIQTLLQNMTASKLRDEGRRLTLDKVFDQMEKAPVGKYCVRAHVKSAEPVEPHKMIRVFCPTCAELLPEDVKPTTDPVPCKSCGGQTELSILLQVVFRHKVGELRAHVWRDHAVYFLGQFISNPAHLLTDPDRARAVSVTLRNLKGVPLDAVLVTYLPSAARGNKAFSQVQIWDTQLCRD